MPVDQQTSYCLLKVVSIYLMCLNYVFKKFSICLMCLIMFFKSCFYLSDVFKLCLQLEKLSLKKKKKIG